MTLDELQETVDDGCCSEFKEFGRNPLDTTEADS